LEGSVKYLLFLGSGRTGSTVLGHSLNSHPEIFISREMRVLQSAIERNLPVSSFSEKIIQHAISDYFHPTANMENSAASLWQKDWIYADRMMKKPSESVIAIGDKKQGGNTKILRSDPMKVSSALLGFDVIYITCIRRPDQVMRSYLNVGKSPESAVIEMTDDMILGAEHVVSNRGIVVIYEELLRNPKKELSLVLDTICAKMYSDDLARMSTQINRSKNSNPAIDEEARLLINSYYPGFLKEIVNLVSIRRPDIKDAWRI
jgi:hypothetical protein